MIPSAFSAYTEGMGLGTFTNPASLPLWVIWQRLDGAPKLDVVSSSVRVLRPSGSGTVVQVLAPTALVNVAGTPLWQFVWSAPTLTVEENLLVEYTAVDSEGATGIVTEGLAIFDEAKEDALVLTQLGDVLDALLGRQKLDPGTKTWTLYRRNGTILKVFDVFDDTNAPNGQDVFERRDQ